MKLINSARFTAVLDANVLFPIVIRDYLIWLAVYDLFSPKWSSKLLEEFKAVFRKKKYKLTDQQIIRQVELMSIACPNALVEKYEGLITSVELKDLKFREMLLNKNKPPYEEHEYLDILRTNGLIQTANELEKYLSMSSG